MILGNLPTELLSGFATKEKTNLGVQVDCLWINRDIFSLWIYGCSCV